MGALPVEPPLHVYVSDLDVYGCNYPIGGGMICGQSDGAPVHNVLKLEGTVEPVERRRTYYDTHAGRITLDNPPTITQEFVVFFDQCVQLMQEKNEQYGDAWRRQGYMGNLARVMSKSDRLRNLLWSSNATYVGDEPIEETLRDMVNLSVFMYLNYREGNQWGQ